MVKFESCTIVVGGMGSISEGSCVAGASVVAGIAGTSEEESLDEGDGLSVGTAVVGSPVENTKETEEGELLGERDLTLVGFSLGALEISAPVGTDVVGSFEGEGDGRSNVFTGAAVAGVSVNAGTAGESLEG
jgi:hypothetical protein